LRRTIVLIVLVPVISLIATSVALAAIERFSARLNGAQEVPPVMTAAQGTARLTKVSDTRIRYVVTASNITNVSGAHIHLARRGVEGDIVVDFRAPSACTEQATSITCQGAITRARLSGPLRGRPLSALVQAMRGGRAYVNVHTDDGVAPPDTGPGDFPGGEIRGQIRRGF
jgi:hypothetical protein